MTTLEESFDDRLAEAAAVEFEYVDPRAFGRGWRRMRRDVRKFLLARLYRRVARRIVPMIQTGDRAALHSYCARIRATLDRRAAAAGLAMIDSGAIEEFPLRDGDSGSIDYPPEETRWFRPRESRPENLLFYVHGGSFITDGSAEMTRVMSRLAVQAEAAMIRPAYRLAPEHPCPAAVDDILKSYRWVVERQPDRPVVVVAESAGCNIALVALQRAIAEGLPAPCGVILFSPFVDLALTSFSAIAHSILDRTSSGLDLTALSVQLYLQGRIPTDALANPLFGSFENFPPMLIHTSQADMLHDDALAIAERMRETNGALQVRVWTDEDHVWEQYESREADASIAKAAEFARSLFRIR
ncbi:MAG: hypothetical protein CL534_18515 [Ahrensia sp.]|nr:hypothetical protein [Ahrensia sp.]